MHAIPRDMVCILGEVAGPLDARPLGRLCLWPARICALRHAVPSGSPQPLTLSGNSRTAVRSLRRTNAGIVSPGLHRWAGGGLAPLGRGGLAPLGRALTDESAPDTAPLRTGARRAIGTCRTRTRRSLRHQDCTRQNGNRLRPMGRDFMRGATPRLLRLRCDAYCRMYEKDGCSVRLLHPQRWHDPLHRMLSERAVGSGSFHARRAPLHRVLWWPCTVFCWHLRAARLAAQPSLRCATTTSSIRRTRRNIPRCAQIGSAPRQAPVCPGADVGGPVPAQMRVGQSRRRCGWASPGADVGGPVPAQMWVGQSRRRRGPPL